MSGQSALLAVLGLFLATGIVVLAELDITPASVRRHYEKVAITDTDTADLMREYPLLCAASHVFIYLIGLMMWPLVVWALGNQRRS
jgi:hypothetical protein